MQEGTVSQRNNYINNRYEHEQVAKRSMVKFSTKTAPMHVEPLPKSTEKKQIKKNIAFDNLEP